MATSEEVRFHSQGSAIAATLTLPDGAGPDHRVPGIVQGPGWLGLRDAKLYRPYHEALLAAGIAVLVFDYRGFGDSEGDATYLDPMDQVVDWRERRHLPRATRPEIDARSHRRVRIRRDRRRQRDHGGRSRRSHQGDGQPGARSRTAATGSIGCAASTSGSSSCERIRTDRERRVATRRPASSWRRATGSWCRRRSGGRRPSRATWTGACRTRSLLASAEAIFAYRPIDVVDRIAPRALMIICVENDATTPEDHALRPVRAGGRSQAARRPDRHDPLRGLRAVPGRRQPAHRRVVPALSRRRRGRSSTRTPADAGHHAISTVRPAGSADAGRRRMTRYDLVIRAAPLVDAPRAAPSPTSPSATGGSRRSSRPGRRSMRDARHRRHRQARPAGRDRRPLAPPRAGLHPQGGHRHAPPPRAPPAV